MSIESEQVQNQPLRVPDISVENSGSEGVTTSTAYIENRVKTVQIGAGFTQVQLPNGFAYDAGDQVELTQHEFNQISAVAISAGVVVDITESV